MKRSIIAAALLSTCFISAGAFAADTGTLTINGEIAGSTCTFEDTTSNQTITLRTVSVEDINKLGLYQVYPGEIGYAEKGVIINCNEDTTNVKLKINPGVINQTDGRVIAAGDTGVGYHVFIDEGSNDALYMNKDIDLAGYVIAGQKGKYRVPFSAKYVKASNTIKSGPTTATLNMIVYQD